MSGNKYHSGNELLNAVACKIRLLRAARGWTQETLAALTGLHPNYIGRIERAETNIGLKNLARIADAFEISAHELLQPDQYVRRRHPTIKEPTIRYLVGHA